MSIGLTILLSCLVYVLFGVFTVTIMIVIAKDRALRAEANGNLNEMRVYWYRNDAFEYSVLYDSSRYLYTTIYIFVWPLIAIVWIFKSIVMIPYKISNILMKYTKYIKEGDRYIKTKRKDSEFEEER